MADNKNEEKQCPFRYRSISWALYMEDFSDLTIRQIAEVFDVPVYTIRNAMSYIKKETGKIVEYRHVYDKVEEGEKENGVEERPSE